MSTVYTTRPVGWVSYQETPESRPTCEVFETDRSPIRTGLLDVNGDPIYRVEQRDPIGFVVRS